ncbi:MAG TPA: slipin family protein [Gammaproteobacteria bacterium]|nr:slipin family protein [Gammaproteobacteria bacterium]
MGEFMFFFAIIAAIVLFNTVKILKEYERGVVFTLGRFWKVKGPGIIILIPWIQTLVRVQLRTVVMDVPSQDVISKDNISVRVNAVVYFRVSNPDLAIIQVENYFEATSQLAQTTLRSVLGEYELDEMLQGREKLNARIRTILDEATDAWGVKVNNVEIKDLEIDPAMKNAIAKQAEAERERRAKVIIAEGEAQAAEKISEAAEVLSKNEASLFIRYLQTVNEAANNESSTIIFPVPTTLMDILTKLNKK